MKYMCEKLALPSLTLKNRLVMPPMATSACDEAGHVTEQLLNYYDEKSKGGYFGLIITEHCFISKIGQAGAGQMSVGDDSDMEGMKRLAEVIHRNHTPAVVQINHSGGMAQRSITGLETIGPSTAEVMPGRLAERAMEKDDISRVIEEFAKAARRVRLSGFDGVEIHSAHRYLLNQFYSPLTNKRTDEYGGGIENRIRLHLQVIDAVRSEVGSDFPVFLRLGALDYMEGGNTIEDAVYAARAFERTGVDVLDISGGMCSYQAPGKTGIQGYFAEETGILKKEVRLPIILTGGIVEMEAAERLLAEEKADLIGVGRAVLKDSLWAKRAWEE